MSNEEAIASVVRAYARCIHEQEEGPFRELWCQNSTCTLISITTAYVGIDAIWHDFIGKLAQIYSTITLVEEKLSIVCLTDDVAVVTFGYHTECERRETGEPYGIAGIETQVLVREDGTWRIAHVHYSK